MAGIPTYRPTRTQCANLRRYVDQKQYDSSLGICKIVLPKGVLPLATEARARKVRARQPLRQTVVGAEEGGWFTVQLRPRKTRDAGELFDASREPVRDQRAFWSGCRAAPPPTYGTDTPGSLLPEGAGLNSLFPSALDGSVEMKGINTPYLYAGVSGSMFPWHCEDMDMFSVNYHHWGAPKVWHTFSRADNAKFEKALGKKHAAHRRKCPEFIRHKVYMTRPDTLLREAGIQVHHIEQRPGELIVTFPTGYHCGYNAGPNMCEAINFVTESWAPYGAAAGRCECRANTVYVDPAQLRFEAGDEEFDAREKHCVCESVWDGTKSMLECEECGRWFHHACVGLAEGYEGAFSCRDHGGASS